MKNAHDNGCTRPLEDAHRKCPTPIRQDVDLGLVCRNVRTSGFKLALVVGYPTNHSSKLRVCFWRAASARWTKPVLVEAYDLTMLVEDDHKRRHAVISRAAWTALNLKLVARVWS